MDDWDTSPAARSYACRLAWSRRSRGSTRRLRGLDGLRPTLRGRKVSMISVGSLNLVVSAANEAGDVRPATATRGLRPVSERRPELRGRRHAAGGRAHRTASRKVGRDDIQLAHARILEQVFPRDEQLPCSAPRYCSDVAGIRIECADSRWLDGRGSEGRDVARTRRRHLKLLMDLRFAPARP